MKKNKGFISIAIILVALATVVAGYFVIQNNNLSSQSGAASNDAKIERFTQELDHGNSNKNDNALSIQEGSNIVLDSANTTTQEQKDLSKSNTELYSQETSDVILTEAQKLNKKIGSNSIFITEKSKENSIVDLQTIAKEREDKLITLAKTDAFSALVAIKKDQDAGLIKELPADLVEKSINQTVDLYVIHVDDFKNHTDSHMYYIIKDGKKYDFYPSQPIQSDVSGKAEVSGYVLDGAIIGTAKNIVPYKQTKSTSAKGGSTEIPIIITTERTAVFLLTQKQVNDTTLPFTPTQFHNTIFNGQFEKYMEEQSYGQTKFVGDVYGWIIEPSTYTPGCAGDNIGQNGVLDSYITDNTINLANYDRILIVDELVGGGCSFVGKMPIYFNGYHITDASESWVGAYDWDHRSYWADPNIRLPYAWTNLDYVTSHELGHALGVLHANGWDCDEVTIYGPNCQHLEYGNYFDVMGSGWGYAFQFNALYKEILGWLKPSDILTISQSGTYSINPLETTRGKRAARIMIQPTGTSSPIYPYYLEYRQNIGFDSQLNNPNLVNNTQGLFVLRKINYGPYAPATTRILDMQPTTAQWLDDLKSTTLNGADTFFDTETGVTIGPIISHLSNRITFHVGIGNVPDCIAQPPLIPSFDGYPIIIHSGDTLHLQFGFYNNDYITCDKSSFDVAFSGPLVGSPVVWSGLDYYPEEGFSNFSNTVQIDPLIPTGNYMVTLTIKNTITGLSSSKNIKITVI